MSPRRCLLLIALLPLAPALSKDGEVALLTDEAIPRYLERGRELARAQQWEKMCDVLQRVIEGDPRIFPDLKPELLYAAVHSTDGEVYRPAREVCLLELARLPPEGLATYRSLYDRAARDAFEAAAAETTIEERLAGYAAVYEPYLVSSYGDDALEAAADLNLALGRHDEALAQLRRLLDVYPKDTDRDLPMALAKAAYCAARLGNGEIRAALLDRLLTDHAEARIRIEGAALPARDLPAHAALAMRRSGADPSGDDWPCALGNPAGTGVGEDLPDTLPPGPLWRFGLHERDARLVARNGHWVPDKRDRAPSPEPGTRTSKECARAYPAVRPIVVDGVVYYKDGREVVARLASSGALVHVLEFFSDQKMLALRHDEPMPVGWVRPGAGGRNAATSAITEEIYRYLDYGGHTVAATRDHLVTVAWQGAAPAHYITGPGRPDPRPSLLAVYKRDEGKTHWVWDSTPDLCSLAIRADPVLFAAWKRDWIAHQFVQFLGPGLIRDGVLYTLAQEPDSGFGVALWAFRVEDGRVLFRTQLHRRDEAERALPAGAALAVAGGVVYALTGAGVVAAVDALAPGRIKWIRRYPRSIESGGAGGRVPTLRQRLAYNDPIVAGGLVLCAPVDGKSFFAIDADTGRLVWEMPLSRETGTVQHVLGVGGGALVLAGSDSVVAVEVATGKRRWGPHLLQDVSAFGRGFLGPRYAYVPTRLPRMNSTRIQRYEIATGAMAPPLRFDVERLGNLLSVGGRLIVANDEEILCFSTPEAERGRLDRRGGDPAAIDFERGLLALAGSPPAREEAAACFRRALAAPPRQGHFAEGYCEQVALDNLYALARERASVEPLAEARAIAKSLDELRGAGRPRLNAAQAEFVAIEVLAKAGRSDEALALIERFPADYAAEKVASGGQILAAATAARALRQRLLERRDFRAAFEKRVRAAISAAAERGDLEELLALPARLDHEAPSEEAYFALARLHEGRGEIGLAALAYRSVVEHHPDHARCPEAQLELARLLLGQGLAGEARRWRDRAVARIDEEQRRRLAPLLSTISDALVGAGKIGLLPKVSLPLRAAPLAAAGESPVVVDGALREDLPPGYVVTADDAGYSAWDGAGTRLWRVGNAAGEALPPGPPGSADTAAAAAAVASARSAIAVGNDLLLADVTGVVRVDALTGEVRWQRPPLPEHAAAAARHAMVDLREELARAFAEGVRARRNPLPSHALAGTLLLRVNPRSGIEAYDVATGSLAWQDIDVKGPTVGGPHVEGRLFAVGWAEPAVVRVLDLDGREVSAVREGGVLLAPPVLDPLGRLFVVAGGAGGGSMTVRSARDGSPLGGAPLRAHSPYAAVLYADGLRAVYHDGAAGTPNLHFLDFTRDAPAASVAVEPMLRDFHVVRDGARLFLLTFTQGVRDTGARLVRIDTEAREALSYEYPPLCRAYARPLLTQRYLVFAGSDGRGSCLRLYDREASQGRSAACEVFALPGGARLSDRLDFEAAAGGEPLRFNVATAVASSAEGLVFGGPLGIWRLAAEGGR